MKREHPVQANANIVVSRTRARWTIEEARLLAQAEAKWLMQGLKTPINCYLHNLFPERTLEAIKGHRRQNKYKELVISETRLVTERSRVEGAPLPQLTNGGDALDRLKEIIVENCTKVASAASPIGLSTRSAARLIEIAEGAIRGLDGVPDSLNKWCLEHLPRGVRPKGPSLNKQRMVEPSGNSRERKKQRYAILQKAYKKGFREASTVIFDENRSVENPVDVNETLSSWKTEFTQPSKPYSADHSRPVPGLVGLWSPITSDEASTRLEAKTSPGIDGISASLWNKVNAEVKCLFFNLCMLLGGLPVCLTEQRTIFIPKEEQGQFRPLTIGCVIQRHFHKILATRLTKLYKLNESQRGFLPCDGTIQNLLVLKNILHRSRKARKELHLASLDLHHAFDTVSHEAILGRLNEIGCPRDFVSYVGQVYNNNYTVLQAGETEISSKVSRGVRQGDPLSPILFNIVLEKVLASLNNSIGFACLGGLVRCLAYADDVILVASTRQGLQMLISHFVDGIETFGLKLNTRKSGVLSLVPDGKNKKIKVLSDPSFYAGEHTLQQIGVLDVWKYLGVTLEGPKVKQNVIPWHTKLELLTKAPLKPQQRLCMVRDFLLPQYTHSLVLGRTTGIHLKKQDKVIRSYVRRWLHLPKDVPLSYFYAPIQSGGLGIPSLYHQIPAILLGRLQKAVVDGTKVVSEIATELLHDAKRNLGTELVSIVGHLLPQHAQEIERVSEVPSTYQEPFQGASNGALVEGESRLHTASNSRKSNQYTKSVRTWWHYKLHSSNDGKELSASSKVKANTRWVRAGAGVRGEDFVHYQQLRINALPSRVRTMRGQHGNTACRAGCRGSDNRQISETNYHTVQQCFRTHGGRILRHNLVRDKICDELVSLGYQVYKEKRFHTSAGLKIPDLIAVKGEEGVLLDCQVVNGNGMSVAHAAKVEKYRSIPLFQDQIGAECNCTRTKFVACTISWKGIWHRGSWDDLCQLGIRKTCLERIVTSVLRGSYLCWKRFNSITTMRSE